MKEMRYYILAPYDGASGGSELAHQMCSELLKDGYMAWMYYFRYFQNEPVDVPANVKFRKYGTSHMKCITEIEKKESIVVVPEAATFWTLTLSNCKKVLWWMSVDNYIVNASVFLQIFSFTEEEYFEALKNTICLHLVQSQYAYQYLLGRGVPAEKILWVSDYIGECYGKFQAPESVRKNIALYNPKKGLEEIKPLIEKTKGWINWVPLIGLTEEQMLSLLSVAKVYVDFGSHPGKDRIPREAASCGCCVITNRKGSANFYEDVPIADCYKFNNVSEEYDKIEILLKDIFHDWKKHNKRFEEYRRFISTEREKFSEDVKRFADVMQYIV